MCFTSQFTFQAFGKQRIQSIIYPAAQQKPSGMYLHGVEAPCFDVIARRHVHPHQSIEGHAQQLFFTLAHEFDDEKRDAVLGQRLPGCNEFYTLTHTFSNFFL